MHILILGSGGREHALGWKLKQSPKVTQLSFAPGNAGIESVGNRLDLFSSASPSDGAELFFKELVIFCKEQRVDLVVVGSDEYLAFGVVDALGREGIKAFGPTQAAAEIEWSKAFSKQLMKEEGIPTAEYEIFDSADTALAYIDTYARAGKAFPLVIKADGLAFGKGVVIATTVEEATAAIRDMMEKKVHGNAGSHIVIEEYLSGKEISTHAFCDGETAIMFPAAQDHKRAYDEDRGPNTGGMGTIAPVPWVTDADLEDIKVKVVEPVLRALKKRGAEFKGVLFPGIMMTEQGPKVIEFNARFGDPETQSYMRILESDLLDILLACINGELAAFHNAQRISWSKQYACCVAVVSGGYPGDYEKGYPIDGLDKIKAPSVVFHAGTAFKIEEGRPILVTSGGRVLGVTSIADTLQEALNQAYEAAGHVYFCNSFYRKDIGKKSLT